MITHAELWIWDWCVPVWGGVVLTTCELSMWKNQFDVCVCVCVCLCVCVCVGWLSVGISVLVAFPVWASMVVNQHVFPQRSCLLPYTCHYPVRWDGGGGGSNHGGASSQLSKNADHGSGYRWWIGGRSNKNRLSWLITFMEWRVIPVR